MSVLQRGQRDRGVTTDSPRRNARDADVQKAADHQAEDAEEHEQRRRHRVRSPAAAA